MADENEEYGGEWYAYENGETLNDLGPTNGTVLRDEELGEREDEDDTDARLTMEEGRAPATGFFLTATFYGWMYHTHQVATQAEGEAAYQAMKAELERMALLIPYEEDGAKGAADKAAHLTEAIAAFERRFA